MKISAWVGEKCDNEKMDPSVRREADRQLNSGYAYERTFTIVCGSTTVR